MKKMTTVMGAVLLAGGVLAACSDADTTKSGETPEKQETEQTTDQATAPEQEVEKETNASPKEESKSEPVAEEVEATGIYNGMADPHTVEINVNGEDKAFQINPDGEEVKKFEALEAGSEVTFVYKTEGEQMTITQVKTVTTKQDTEQETSEPEQGEMNGQTAVQEVEAKGTYNGMADLHTVEINVDGEDKAFQINPDGEEVKKFEALEEGAEVTFVYKTEGEQMTITQVK
ncbi:hypothetical protein [Bacillus sp. REN10]|uniref:hypothetical protein n=1 Tax=Bacillus sp. REN10 TaxID=2782541 RepID=UPI00193B6308|nr:hypothetical protein [Bacillus sp. REN10]